MKNLLGRCFLAVGTICASLFAFAADELVVQVSRDGAPVTTTTVVLDNSISKVVDSNGLVTFDLGSGGHTLQFNDGPLPLHRVAFNAAVGQLVDVNVDLSDVDNPVDSVESYFKVETAAQRTSAPTGTIEGNITSNGLPVDNATVSVRGLNVETVTDGNGSYKLEVPRGVYQLSISHGNIGSLDVNNYRVISNVTKRSNFSLNQLSQTVVEEVVVVGSAGIGGLQESERFSANVIDTVDIEQLARFGDADIAASIVRVPSVTVQDGQYVFIRGLGDRYVTATLNGSTMPSTNPSKRTVPLDLFPSNLIEQLDVKKSFIPSMPGESTGGNLVINTRTFPSQATGKLSISLGYVDGLTGDTAFVDSQDGDFDFLGWDDGTRALPGITEGVAEALKYTNYYGDDVEQQLGYLGADSIKNDWNYDKQSANPDVAIGLSYGDVFDLDNGDFGYFISGNYKNEWNQKTDGVRRTYSGLNASVTNDDFKFEEYNNDIDASGLISLGLNLGRSSYKSNTLVSRVTQESVRYEEGVEGDEFQDSIRWSIEWEERQYLSQQFAGEHILGSDDQWTIDWQGTLSQAERYAPDRRDVRFDLEGSDGVYNLEVPSIARRYDELTDDNVDISTDIEYVLSYGDWEQKLKGGLQGISRERDSDSNTYGFRGGLLTVDDNAPNLQVDEVINDNTITGNPSTGYTFQDKTLPSDSYDAEMDLNSAYLYYDATWKLKYQLVLGARYEDYKQVTDTFSLQGTQEAVESEIEEDSLLPALSFNWFLTEEQQLRFAFSETVARPDFKETSNATFYDEEFGFRVRGNPNLKISEIKNYDVRWEKYWSDQESLSIALFYKDMENPIERVVQAASGTVGNSRTFQNADSAEITGIELDTRKSFAFNDSGTKTMFVALNASYLDSEVTLLNGKTRELQGAPDYTFNMIFGYDDIERGHELTLLFNQSGETIVDVGVSGQPDIIEEPRLSADVNYKYYLSDDITFKAKIQNLLDSEVEFTQGGNVYQRYKTGLEFKAGFDWSF